MKTIISIVICFCFLTSGLFCQKTSKVVSLQSSDKNSTPELLKQASMVITKRLNIYGMTSPAVSLIENNQIKVQLPENIDLSEIEGLLTSRGNIGFYETLTQKEITGTSDSAPKSSPSEARLVCSSSENKHLADSVENFLKSKNLLKGCKLFWGVKNSKSQTCLYALKVDGAGNPPIMRKDLETINSSKDNDSQSITLKMKFKPSSSALWAAITKESLGKPIAIVVGDKVFYTPVVKSSMENGLCEITGNFTQKEVKYFLAFANNDPLPISLTLAK